RPVRRQRRQQPRWLRDARTRGGQLVHAAPPRDAPRRLPSGAALDVPEHAGTERRDEARTARGRRDLLPRLTPERRIIARMASLSYAHGTSPTPLLGETIGENLRRTALRFGDRDALVVRSQGYRATYRELWDATTAAAKALLARGIARGD